MGLNRQVRLAKKRERKNLARKRIREHKQRVGPNAYYGDKILAICDGCKQTRKLHQMTAVAGGLGMGVCKFCVEAKEKENVGK